jgi:hypothetical protein
VIARTASSLRIHFTSHLRSISSISGHSRTRREHYDQFAASPGLVHAIRQA